MRPHRFPKMIAAVRKTAEIKFYLCFLLTVRYELIEEDLMFDPGIRKSRIPGYMDRVRKQYPYKFNFYSKTLGEHCLFIEKEIRDVSPRIWWKEAGDQRFVDAVKRVRTKGNTTWLLNYRFNR